MRPTVADTRSHTDQRVRTVLKGHADGETYVNQTATD